jgi:hypothetical protein
MSQISLKRMFSRNKQHNAVGAKRSSNTPKIIVLENNGNSCKLDYAAANNVVQPTETYPSVPIVDDDSKNSHDEIHLNIENLPIYDGICYYFKSRYYLSFFVQMMIWQPIRRLVTLFIDWQSLKKRKRQQQQRHYLQQLRSNQKNKNRLYRNYYMIYKIFFRPVSTAERVIK